jgi:hypothetical protein
VATNRVLARNGPQELQQHLWLTTVNLTETGKTGSHYHGHREAFDG